MVVWRIALHGHLESSLGLQWTVTHSAVRPPKVKAVFEEA